MCWKVVNVSKNGLLDLGKFFSTTREIFVYKIKKLNCTLYHFLRYLHIGCVIIFEILLFVIVRDKIF